MKKFRFLLPFVVMMAGMASCKKDDVKTEAPKVTTGVYVLNEGLLSQTLSSLTYYDFGTSKPVTDYYANVNGGSEIGDTGNDLLIYGGKMYIVVNASSNVRVCDVSTAKSIKEIPFKNGSALRKPRNVVAYKNMVFVSSYDNSVSVIDTATLEITKTITVGANPEQMVISGDKLYVANGGGFTPGKDSTISVVSLTSFTELQKIKVGLGPNCLAADSANNIYVGCVGNYSTVGPKLVKVSTTSNTVVKSVDTAVGTIRYFDGYLYATGGWSGSAYIRKLNLTDFSQASPNFVTDGTVVTMAYALNIDVNTGDVWVGDAKDYQTSGEVFCFDRNGKKKHSFSVTPGLNPNTIAFIKQ
jgi:YVTN family beta-propeller protein